MYVVYPAKKRVLSALVNQLLDVSDARFSFGRFLASYMNAPGDGLRIFPETTTWKYGLFLLFVADGCGVG